MPEGESGCPTCSGKVVSSGQLGVSLCLAIAGASVVGDAILWYTHRQWLAVLGGLLTLPYAAMLSFKLTGAMWKRWE